jgi:hypothetical protein
MSDAVLPLDAPPKADPTLARGLTIARVFSTEGQDPFASVVWEQRDAVIRGGGGKTVF